MVAHQILDLLVLVRIQVGLQAFAKTETLAKAFFYSFLLSESRRRLAALKKIYKFAQRRIMTIL